MNLSFLMKTAAAVAVMSAGAFPAHGLEAPKGDVILTVIGAKLSHPNGDGKAVFDLAMLEGMAGRTAKMETPWTSGQVTFSGPLLKAILDEAGAKGRTLKVKALNDYVAEIPADDASKLETILATRMDGKTMSVRDKGPLFLIYPFDKNRELYNEKYFARSVWQIKEIEVVE